MNACDEPQTRERAIFAAHNTNVKGMWQWFVRVTRLLQSRTRPQKQLRLCETLGLGERRFIAVVQFEQQKFLIGGTGSSLALLTHLGQTAEETRANAEEARN